MAVFVSGGSVSGQRNSRDLKWHQSSLTSVLYGPYSKMLKVAAVPQADCGFVSLSRHQLLFSNVFKVLGDNFGQTALLCISSVLRL